jgi:RNA polymerase sigma-70 factor (ECF subfamily)
MDCARPLTVHLDDLADDELLRRARDAGDAVVAAAARDALFRRYHPKVAAWSLRFCGDREAAADLAQEVLLRVHERLDTFRGDSRFSTWLYTVTRRVAINRGEASRRRQASSLEDVAVEPRDPAEDAASAAARGEVLAAFREAMRSGLEPMEARVLYLHYVDGMTLPAITEHLGLDNRSGAKAYVVAGRRKLERRFGPWLRDQGGWW